MATRPSKESTDFVLIVVVVVAVVVVVVVVVVLLHRLSSEHESLLSKRHSREASKPVSTRASKRIQYACVIRLFIQARGSKWCHNWSARLAQPQAVPLFRQLGG
ncbi:putative Ni/Fe-hydrogenase B-type cytochrome subunit [Trichinella spiralis]|uniref:putative Ni/Fe-hydrogenase B-type cytochrome subunit n=1 Tax=Trichinella spiralis TaxID=6334 RepID=UPI0001EFE075|nr:putative Ni/Fe-hydrogenase B-type cytochrome subunit [Trichinella spiralis]